MIRAKKLSQDSFFYEINIYFTMNLLNFPDNLNIRAEADMKPIKHMIRPSYAP